VDCDGIRCFRLFDDEEDKIDDFQLKTVYFNTILQIELYNRFTNLVLVCAECQCAPEECAKDISNFTQCKNCTKRICCCIDLHQDLSDDTSHFNNHIAFYSRFSSKITFFRYAKGIYAAALGIEILCIAAAEIGENTALYLFGFNPLGIVIAYSLGYALAGFTTFATILGRYNYGSPNQTMCGCCSVLEQDSQKGFVLNLKTTFRNFAVGTRKLPYLYKQQNLKNLLKTSLVILITAESICILTAETVDLIFFQYSIMLSIPLALFAGAFTVVAPEAYRKTRKTRGSPPGNNNFISFSNFKTK
jgi:hypothetical protein